MMRFTLNKLYQLLIDISFLLTAFECYRIFFSDFDDFLSVTAVPKRGHEVCFPGQPKCYLSNLGLYVFGY